MEIGHSRITKEVASNLRVWLQKIRPGRAVASTLQE